MSLKVRVATAAAAAVALTASPALAAFTPKVVVSSTPTLLTVKYSENAGDDAAAKLNVLVPSGYLANIGGFPGDKVASVSGRTASSTFTGSLVVANATDPVTIGGAATTVGAANTACTGPGTVVGATWIANLTVGGATVAVPVAFLNVLGGMPYSDFATNAIVLCPPASIGAITSLDLSFSQIFSVAPGWYVWHALATPTTNAAGTVETESEDRTPPELSLAVRRSGKNSILSGKLLQGGKGVSGQTVQLKAGTKVVATAKTRSGGAYRVTLKPAKTQRLKASATVADRSLGACQQAATATCNGATVGGFSASSGTVTVRP